jgi:glycine/D-amino acid oxidase-like deaminating enzyme
VSLPAPSLWLAEVERSTWRPRLTGALDVDVAVVGGGLSGLWAAHAVLDRRPGAAVAVFEAERLGWGASGRNGGWASALFPVAWSRVARDFDVGLARSLRRRLVENLGELEEFLGPDAASVGWRRQGTLTVARSPAQWRRLLEERRSFDELGLAEPPRVLDARGASYYLRVRGALGGLWESACASVHPARLVELLAHRLEDRGGLVFERTRLHMASPGTLVGIEGRVRAGQVVWATESYLAATRTWHRALTPIASQIIATEPLSREQLEALGQPAPGLTFTDARRLVIYGQLRDDGRIVFGGRGAPYRYGSRLEFATTVDPRRGALLKGTLEELLGSPGPLEVAHAWGGTIGVTRDWYPRVLHDPRTRFTLIGGYAGDGVALTRLVGGLAGAYATGKGLDSELAVVLGRTLRSWEPEPLRWLGINVGLGLTRLADRLDPHPAAEVVDVVRARLLGQA